MFGKRLGHPKPDPIKAGQRSVWDFPRPPALERVRGSLRIGLGGEVVAATEAGLMVLETSHPPVYFFPRADVDERFVRASPRGKTHCEWKGAATYWDVVVGEILLEAVAFSYERPVPRFAELRGMLSFYAGPFIERGGACFVGDERAEPQPGGFYSGWVTSGYAGPFKGIEGSWGW
ncbi:MAG: DUF427 domain-containing protein [Planctomycetota bacterium]